MAVLSPLSESAGKLLEASQTLSVDERIDLALAIWDSLSKQGIPSDLSDEQRAELELRWQDHLAHPENAVSWEEGKARLATLRDTR